MKFNIEPARPRPHTGPKALEVAQAEQPDVILLDIGLPGMDGYEVARRLREQQGAGRVHLLAMTGYGQESDRKRSQEAGFDHHLVKPVEFEVVLALLARDADRRPGQGPHTAMAPASSSGESGKHIVL